MPALEHAALRPWTRGALAETLKQIVATDPYDATSVGFNGAREVFLKSLDPDAAFAIVPDAGHWVQFEAAAAFNKILSKMLRRRDAVTMEWWLRGASDCADGSR
jgi:hypothetical protein